MWKKGLTPQIWANHWVVKISIIFGKSKLHDNMSGNTTLGSRAERGGWMGVVTSQPPKKKSEKTNKQTEGNRWENNNKIKKIYQNYPNAVFKWVKTDDFLMWSPPLPLIFPKSPPRKKTIPGMPLPGRYRSRLLGINLLYKVKMQYLHFR